MVIRFGGLYSGGQKAQTCQRKYIHNSKGDSRHNHVGAQIKSDLSMSTFSFDFIPTIACPRNSFNSIKPLKS